MAIWQFQCYIIPKYNFDVRLTGDEILAWQSNSIENTKILFLEQSDSWSESIIQYGMDDETCIQFFYFKSNTLCEINCRVDLRTITKELLQKIVDYVKEIDGLILYDEKVYVPELEVVKELIASSDAYRFCVNPKDYFESLSKECGSVEDTEN